MFTSKKKELFSPEAKKNTKGTVNSVKGIGQESNAFLRATLNGPKVTVTGNGAKAYSSSGNEFVNQFNNLGLYKKPRTYADIANDCNNLWNLSSLITVKFILFLRIISRIVSYWDGNKTEKVQKGAGLKHEAINRMMWLSVNFPDTFWRNIQLFIACGSWKDVFEMLRMDLEYNGWENRVLDWDKFSILISSGLENPNTSELVKKYLPRIEAKSKCTTLHKQSSTIIGKWIASELAFTYEVYRRMKSSGQAHKWQQLISQKLFSKIDFNSIHGRALSLFVSSKFLKNHGLVEKYSTWISSKPAAKFTGYVHELAANISKALLPHQIETINKQYITLLELAKKNVNLKSGLIVVRDTSGSMGSNIPAAKISAGDVAKALSIFFGDMLEGPFKDAWIEFDSQATMRKHKGKTFVEKWRNDTASYTGSTNFQAACRVFIAPKLKGVPESEYPTGMLIISDGEFNPSYLGKTNIESLKGDLKNAGFSKAYLDKFQIVLWNITNNYYGPTQKPKFESPAGTKNVFHVSGYDGSILGFLLGDEGKDGKIPTTSEELFDAVMDQEILDLVEL